MKQQFSDIRQSGSTGQQSLIEKKQSESYVSTSLDLEVTSYSTGRKITGRVGWSYQVEQSKFIVQRSHFG